MQLGDCFVYYYYLYFFGISGLVEKVDVRQ